MDSKNKDKPASEPKEWTPCGWYLLDTETGRVVVDGWDRKSVGCWEMAPGFSIDTRPLDLPTFRRLPGVVAVNGPPPSISPRNGISLRELRESGRVLPENEEEKEKREKWEREIKELVEGCFNKPKTPPDSEPPKS